MKTIYKYKIVSGLNTIEMPYYSEILTVQVQNEVPHIWAKVDTDNNTEIRKFFTVPTGYDLEQILQSCNATLEYDKYIGTFQMPNYNLVFHLYEVK